MEKQMKSNNFSKKWNQVLSSKNCHGYYDKNPCKAHTGGLKHLYCKRHQNLLRKREEDAKKN